MTLTDILKNVSSGMNHAKPKIDRVADYALIPLAANAGMFAGLIKIIDSELPAFQKGLACAGWSFLALGINLFPVKYLVKRSVEDNRRKSRFREGSNFLHWAKSALIAGTIVTSAIYSAKRVPFLAYNEFDSIPVSVQANDPSKKMRVKLAKYNDVIGSLQRTMRWEPLINEYSKKFNLPPEIIAGVIMQECYGDITQINEHDGGTGAGHFQPATWYERGKVGPDNVEPFVYQDCHALRSRAHANALKEMIRENDGDPERIARKDNRFDPRVMIYEICELIAERAREYKIIDPKLSSRQALDQALGSYNAGPGARKGKTARRYAKEIRTHAHQFTNPKFRRKAGLDFNERNTSRDITFPEYLAYFRQKIMVN
jgi:hypothetical protein